MDFMGVLRALITSFGVAGFGSWPSTAELAIKASARQAPPINSLILDIGVSLQLCGHSKLCLDFGITISASNGDRPSMRVKERPSFRWTQDPRASSRFFGGVRGWGGVERLQILNLCGIELVPRPQKELRRSLAGPRQKPRSPPGKQDHVL